MPAIPDSMQRDLRSVRHRIVAIEDGAVVLAVSSGSRPARRIKAMGYDVTSAGPGRIVVRSP